VGQREDLEERARQQAELLVEHLVQSSERVDFRQGTYLLAALASELGGHVQRRCWELGRETDPIWEVAASEAETLINASWRCMATIWGQSELEDRRARDRQERRRREENARRQRQARDDQRGRRGEPSA
jgi:hypothetical protein